MVTDTNKCIIGQILPGNYQVKESLGQGIYGYVCRAHKDGQDYAVKVQAAYLPAYIEASLLQTLNHANIIKPVDVVYLPASAEEINQAEREAAVRNQYSLGIRGYFYIYQPLAESDLPVVADLATVILQLLSALAYLESNGIIHCDLKPANIVFLGVNPVLIDFGVAQLYPGSQRMGEFLSVNSKVRFQIQTPYYRAPEVWRQEAYDARIDVFSLGCCLYKWLTESELFTAENLTNFEAELLQVPRKIANVVERLSDNNHPHTKIYNDLLRYMLAPRQQRPFASQLVNNYAPSLVISPTLRLVSQPASWVYPYPMRYGIAEKYRGGVLVDLYSKLYQSGLVQTALTTPDLTEENVLTHLNGAKTATELNDCAWIILAFTVAEELFNMVRTRQNPSQRSFIPNGNRGYSSDTLLQADTMAVYLITGYDGEIYSQRAQVNMVLDEFYQYGNHRIFPKILLSRHNFVSNQEFATSLSAKVIPHYLKNLTSLQWSALPEAEAKATLRQQAEK